MKKSNIRPSGIQLTYLKYDVSAESFVTMQKNTFSWKETDIKQWTKRNQWWLEESTI